MEKNFNHSEVETRLYSKWLSKKHFASIPNSKPAYTVVIPPPNVTGVLHLGHTLNETVQDILVRYARMNGYNACWVPGSDHASIATEAKVVNFLQEKGIQKNDITRDEFLGHAFEWKEKYGNIIYNQIQRLGCSCDWDRVTFTMDEHYYKAVIKVFVDMYQKGLIYRGARMINWDPAAKTALSDEEVEYKEVNSQLYYINYKIENSDDFITVATTRPETILGDVAICVNPNDERYSHLVGKHVFVPLINRLIPIIADDYVDAAFGTGCLKITPAHDINDYNIGLKHQLPIIDTLNDDGTLSEAAQLYIGEDRFVVRKKIAKELTEKGFMLKTEPIVNKNGFSQRTQTVVEPRISTQWFLKMGELAPQALEVVTNGSVNFYPKEKFNATYKHWLENIKDWCISRQLWWGQRIPAWYDADGKFVVAETLEEAQKLYVQQHNTNAELKQDDDVLDTWFSSWLWPTQVFEGITKPNNPEVAYYYPTSVLVTGQDIIFFWVARMVMAGLEYEKQIPFKDVYFTGMVRDKQGRKMSKSLGNSPDLLALVDKYGADAIRFGVMIAAPAGNDLLFDESSCEQGSFFVNKLWNATKLIKMWELSDTQNTQNNWASQWMLNKTHKTSHEVKTLIADYKLSEALKKIYNLIWDDFCSTYLEWIKPPFGEKIDTHTMQQTIAIFEKMLQLLSPFMPFIAEELYNIISQQNRDEDLMVTQFQYPDYDNNIIEEGEFTKNIISTLRDLKAKNNLKPKQELPLVINTTQPALYKNNIEIIQKLSSVNPLTFNQDLQGQAIVSALCNKETLTLILSSAGDLNEQKAQITKDLEYYKGFLQSVEKKLSNANFVQNAKPEIVALEQQKKDDAQQKIALLQKSMEQLS